MGGGVRGVVFGVRRDAPRGREFDSVKCGFFSVSVKLLTNWLISSEKFKIFLRMPCNSGGYSSLSGLQPIG